MPTEVRLLGVGVGARMTRSQQVGGDGQGLFDDGGIAVMQDILELAFIDAATGNAYIVPLTPEGVEAVKKALGPQSGLVIPTGVQIPGV